MPAILSAQVIDNPFDDIEPRQAPAIKQSAPVAVIQPAKAVKNKNLISFDDDDGEEPVVVPKRGIKSVHEANSKGLSVQAAVSKEELEAIKAKRELLERSKEELKQNVKAIQEQQPETKVEVEAKVIETEGRKRLDRQLDRLEKERRRSRSRSRSQSPTTQAILRAAGDSKKELEQKKLQEAREQYRALKADLMKFKREDEKIGSNLDRANIDVQVRFTPLAL